MRKQRRHFPMLELLDDRVVPSGVGMAPIAHAAAAEHAAIRAEAHAAKVEAHVLKADEAVHAKAVHNARVHHNRIVPAAHVSGGSAASISVMVGSSANGAAASPATAASPAIVVSATGTGTAQAQVPTVATAAIATSGTPPRRLRTRRFRSATTSDPGDIENGPLAKAGQDLITIYEEFEQQGGSSTFTSSEAGLVRIVGTSVGVDVHSTGGSFANLVSAMTALGMQVQAQNATDGIVEGLLPIGQLVAAAAEFADSEPDSHLCSSAALTMASGVSHPQPDGVTSGGAPSEIGRESSGGDREPLHADLTERPSRTAA